MSFPTWKEDIQLRASFDWFMQFVTPKAWSIRKSRIDKFLKKIHSVRERQIPLTSDSSRIVFEKDQFAWYLYLIEAYLTHPEDYEFSQGARVVPIAKTFGRFINLLESLEGVHERVKKVARNNGLSVDSLFFEILVALAYRRNGWEKVKFIPEKPPNKTPDLHVLTEKKELFVECKRLSKSSQYSIKEREKWLQMWDPLARYLQGKKKSIILEIVFHRELQLFDKLFLEKELVPKLELVAMEGVIIDNPEWTVTIKYVDLKRIKKSLEESSTKIISSTFAHLVTGGHESSHGFTCVMSGKPSLYHPTYIDDIEFVSCAKWKSDSEESIAKKARDIKSHLVDATKQLPIDKPSIIHVGLESHDGAIIEDERFLKILGTTLWWDPKGKEINWIFCHIFDPHVPPDDNWDFGESVLPFSRENSSETPLGNPDLVDLEGVRVNDGVFWR